MQQNLFTRTQPIKNSMYGGRINLPKRNDDFFREKKPWSVIIDSLLGCYLEPYFAKILNTRKPLVYVDCFAGKGQFDDGNLGSPCIALNIFKNRLEKSGVKSPAQTIEAHFIELHYAKELRKNLESYYGMQNLDIVVDASDYEKQIQQILHRKSNANIFLYLDPYGVKHLDFNFLSSLSKKFNSAELLINFNSHGFLRVACKFLKIDVPAEINWSYLAEYDNDFNIPLNKSEEMLNKVAGGNYWQDLTRLYYNKDMSFYQLEETLSQAYCKNLKRYYTYVLNMPIRIKENYSPKYRMIYATNHPDGAILMADNIYKRIGQLHEIQYGGQQLLFGLDYDVYNAEKLIMEYLSKINVIERLSVVQAKFFTDYGVICNSSDFSNIVANLEKSGALEIIRNPDKTKTGRPRRFYNECTGQTLKLKWKN